MSRADNKEHDVAEYRTRVPKLSIASLTVCNLIVILWTVLAKWSFVAVMWVYWTQSIGIGIVWLIRVFSLKNFLVGKRRGRKGPPFEPTFWHKTRVVCAVVLIYGLLHAAYAGFLRSFREPVDFVPIIIAGFLFFAGQLLSFFKEEKLDKDRPPYLQSLNLVLFIRILPIHVVAMVSERLHLSTSPSSYNTYGMVVLLLVKTVVDVFTYAMLEKGWIYESIQRILLKGMPQAQKALYGSPKPALKKKVPCRCTEFDQLEGKDALNYARGHLKVLLMDGPARTLYICPKTKKQWVLDSKTTPDENEEKYFRLRVLQPKENNPDD